MKEGHLCIARDSLCRANMTILLERRDRNEVQLSTKSVKLLKIKSTSCTKLGHNESGIIELGYGGATEIAKPPSIRASLANTVRMPSHCCERIVEY